jgi:hypothetical protein
MQSQICLIIRLNATCAPSSLTPRNLSQTRTFITILPEHDSLLGSALRKVVKRPRATLCDAPANAPGVNECNGEWLLKKSFPEKRSQIWG